MSYAEQAQEEMWAAATPHETKGAAAAAPETSPLVVLAGLAVRGQRVRVTWPNGVSKSGVVRPKKVGVHHCVTLGGLLCGGEYMTATKVEVMGANGRYAEHWTRP